MNVINGVTSRTPINNLAPSVPFSNPRVTAQAC